MQQKLDLVWTVLLWLLLLWNLESLFSVIGSMFYFSCLGTTDVNLLNANSGAAKKL